MIRARAQALDLTAFCMCPACDIPLTGVAPAAGRRGRRWLRGWRRHRGRAAGGQVIPGVRVAHARDHLPNRFGHQLRLILVDVVAALAGHGEARVRDEGGLVLIRRPQDPSNSAVVNPCASAGCGNGLPWARTASGIGRSGEAATASRTTALSAPHRNVSRSP